MSRRRAALQLVEPRVETAATQELGVSAVLVDATVVQHQDAVGGVDRREPVRDRDARTPREESSHRLPDERFGFGIDTRHRFVQDEDGRIVHEGPSDGQQLALSVRDVRAALAQELAAPAWELSDEAGPRALK